MKKITSLLLVLSLLLGCVMALSACGGNDETPPPETKTVMNISMNPEVEFVLDADNKVVSVNALNEEGNLIITAESFVGKDANEAAQLFVSVSKDMGFVVETNVNVANNDINISFSGDTAAAEELYNGVKGKLDEYLASANITVKINQAEAISREKLEEILAECAPYLEEAEIKALEHHELVESIYQSRLETAELYSEELKNAYYEAKAFAMEQAEFEVIKGQLGVVEQAIFDTVNTAYVEAVEKIEKLRMELLVSEDSSYQMFLAVFRTKKAEYLQYREELAALGEGTADSKKMEILAGFEEAVANVEKEVLAAGENANQALDSAKEAAKVLRDKVIASVQSYSAKAEEQLDAIEAKQLEAKTAFFTEFETNYKDAIANAESEWNSMRDDIKGEPAPAE